MAAAVPGPGPRGARARRGRPPSGSRSLRAADAIVAARRSAQAGLYDSRLAGVRACCCRCSTRRRDGRRADLRRTWSRSAPSIARRHDRRLGARSRTTLLGAISQRASSTRCAASTASSTTSRRSRRRRSSGSKIPTRDFVSGRGESAAVHRRAVRAREAARQTFGGGRAYMLDSNLSQGAREPDSGRPRVATAAAGARNVCASDRRRPCGAAPASGQRQVRPPAPGPLARPAHESDPVGAALDSR